MRKFFLVFIILSLITFSAAAQEETQPAAQEETRTGTEGFFSKISWFAEGSILFFPEDNGMRSDPMPILPSPGAGVSYPITNILRAELTLDFYMTHYGYDDVLKRAVPDAIENRTSRVIGFPLAFQLAAYFDVNSFTTVRVYGGPAVDLRIVMIAEDLNEGLDNMTEIRRKTDLVLNYFWSSGRWFMPVLGAGVDFSINPRFRLGIDLRVWAPAYRLWTGEDLPAIEGWRFGPGIRFTIR